MPAFRSTKTHRNAERTNGVTEVAVNALKVFSPVAVVPGKLGQVLNSGYAFFRTEKVYEKSAHVFQGTLALTQIVLATILLFKEQDCKSNSESLCKAALVLDLLYQGSLMAAWVPSELIRENLSATSSDEPSPDARAPLIA